MEKKAKLLLLASIIATLSQASLLGSIQARSQLPICPTDFKYKISYCENPRPTEEDCPPIFYIREPDPQICGVSSKGVKTNFARDCQACMNKDVQYYFNRPCYETPFVCESSEACSNDYCNGHVCKVDSDCPYGWQTCFQNKCIDPCENLKCASCKYGQCLYTKPIGLCIYDSDCEKSWSCVGFQCVDMCLTTPCPPGQNCNRGSCSKIEAK